VSEIDKCQNSDTSTETISATEIIERRPISPVRKLLKIRQYMAKLQEKKKVHFSNVHRILTFTVTVPVLRRGLTHVELLLARLHIV